MDKNYMIGKILDRKDRIAYILEHDKIHKSYADPYLYALDWVLKEVFEFEDPLGCIDDPVYDTLRSTKNGDDEK